MLRRIFRIGIIILVVLSVIVGCSAFLVHQQRNTIVKALATRVQKHFNAAVSISDTRIGFSHGISLDLIDVSVSTDPAAGTAIRLEAPFLHICIDIFALLKGEIICTRAELLSPHIIVNIADNATHARAFSPVQAGKTAETGNAAHIAQSILRGLNASMSSWQHVILNTAMVELHHANYQSVLFSPTNLDIRLNGDSGLPAVTLDSMVHSGDSPPTRINIHTRIKAPGTTPASIDTTTAIHLGSLDLAQLQHYFTQGGGSQAALSGNVDLNLKFKGNLKAGMVVTANITPSENATKQAPVIRYNGIDTGTETIKIAAILTLVPAGLQISEAKISSHIFTLSAAGLIASDGKSIELSCDNIQLVFLDIYTRLLHLPPQWNQYLQGSKLTCNALEYSGPLIPRNYTDLFSSIQASTWNLNLPLESIRAEQLTLAPVQVRIIQNKNLIDITSSELNWSSSWFNVNGHLELKNRWNKNSGKIESSLNLDSLALKINNIRLKERGSAAGADFTLEIFEHGWNLKKGRLTSAELNATFEARQNHLSGFVVEAGLHNFSLDAFRRRFNLLEFMELEGSVDLEYTMEHQHNSGWNGLGKVTLHNCSINPARILGRIHHINGTAYLDNLQVNAPELKLKLGQDSSALTASAMIEDLRHPVADIHASGNGVVANDLIFNSRTALLNNLNGHLRIHARGIDFVSASVDLEQGTHADVSGTLHYSTPDLDLDIHAPYADIDEVIALWNNTPAPEEPNKHSVKNTQQPPQDLAFNETMFIDASVTRGMFSGFNFQNASGRINIQKGQLRIEPLEFNADSGNGQAQIIVHTRNNVKQSSYLKVKGKLRHINADTVYTQIFGDLGLLSGSLNSTFSLHGPIGRQFSPNADGTFSISISNGVLRRFKFLSKAFSLLNVAQLFKMRLPDMSIEGMPFTKLTADLNMENGMLKSNNLFIRSDAMDLALAGQFYLPEMQIDANMNVNPLGTVDSIFSKIPVAGWLLTGDEKTLISIEFDISGPAQEPIVSMKPLASVSSQVKGIIKRAIDLPTTTVTNPGKVFFHQGDKGESSQSN